MSDDEIRHRGSTKVDYDSPGDMVVQIIKQMFQHGATVLATGSLTQIFAGKRTIQEVIFDIHRCGLKLKFHAEVEVPSHIGDKGEIDPAYTLSAMDEEVTIQPGMLNTAEEPMPASVPDNSPVKLH